VIASPPVLYEEEKSDACLAVAGPWIWR